MPTFVERIRAHLLRHEQLSQWPAFVELVNRPAVEGSLPCWEYAVLACRAERGQEDDALPATVALFCQLLGIHLLDDLIDEDPQGRQHEYGVGTVANLASAFQGLAISAISDSELPETTKLEALRRMAEMQTATCWGQQLDAWDAEDEAEYWRLARTKTPPLFGFALALGALAAGAGSRRAAEYDELGVSLGLLVQVSDDASDALSRPAKADWQRRGSNLAILYARNVDHEQRDRFVELASEVDDPEALREAQEILVRCGAFSYCAYKMVKFSQDARAKVADLDPPDHQPLLGFIEHLTEPLVSMLKRAGVEAPGELVRGAGS
ncbi:MAG: polyprenyl synthetase family protein [Thermoanaerobaculia bacterium]|nr:polyprenyl synthetase family protein [Thermoanaerobaculia bacterium]